MISTNLIQIQKETNDGITISAFKKYREEMRQTFLTFSAFSISFASELGGGTSASSVASVPLYSRWVALLRYVQDIERGVE